MLSLEELQAYVIIERASSNTSDGTPEPEKPQEEQPKENKKTITIAALGNKILKEIDDVTICLSASDIFGLYQLKAADLVMADLDSGKCPDDLVACSEKTSPVNTICVKPSDKPDRCPVTDIRIVPREKAAEFAEFQKNTAQINYQQAPQPATILDLDWVLFFSKEFDSQPVTEILLEKEPLCDNQRIGDPNIEMLDISNNKNAYKFDSNCTTDGSYKK